MHICIKIGRDVSRKKVNGRLGDWGGGGTIWWVVEMHKTAEGKRIGPVEVNINHAKGQSS